MARGGKVVGGWTEVGKRRESRQGKGQGWHVSRSATSGSDTTYTHQNSDGTCN